MRGKIGTLQTAMSPDSEVRNVESAVIKSANKSNRLFARFTRLNGLKESWSRQSLSQWCTNSIGNFQK